MPRVKLSSCILATCLPVGMVVGAALAGTPASSRPARHDLRTLTTRTPLLFEKNEGQTDSRAAFLARGDGYTVFVTPSEAVLKLKSRAVEHRSPFVKPGHEQERLAQSHTSVLRMGLVNANPRAKVTGEGSQPTRVSYLRGAGSHSQVATYAKARCREVYPGVDLVYYGNQRQLEYDFVVAPGADPRQIRFQMDGAKDVAVAPEGHLAIRLEDGDVQLQKPVVYQDVEGQRREVSSSYRLAANGEVAFQLGDYDATRPLVIDPVIVYSTLLGGSGFDSGSAVTFGSDGSIYVAGYTQSVDFPSNGGPAPGGPGDAFVTKFSSDGAEVVYSAYLGGSGTDAAGGIGVDSAGRVIVSGYTDSPDFPVPGGFQTTLAGRTDAFIARLNSAGSVVEYGTYLGGADSDGATRLTLDSNGDVYLTGYTSSADFPVSQNAMQPNFRGDYDAFAVKIAKTDGSVVFSTYIGGRDGDSGSGIQVDTQGNVYVGGSTDSGDFPVGPVSLVFAFQGGRFGDAFITKLSPDGSQRIYSTYIGASGSDSGADIAVDQDGFCYLTGTTDSFDLMLDEPEIQPYQPTRPGGVSDIYVTKIYPDGKAFRYMTYLGSPGEDVARALEVDEDLYPHTKAYVLGETSSPLFPLLDALQSNHGGNSDLFLTKLHEDMFRTDPIVVLDYSTFLGGAGLDHAGDLAVDAIGNAAITGDTISNDFPQHQGPAASKKKKAKGGSVQGFVAKVFDGVPEPGGVLDVTRRINFGNVKSGRTVTKKLNIRNISSSRQLAVSVETPRAPVSIGKGIQSVFIKPGGSFQVTVGIIGTTGITNTALVIRSSDPARPVVNIPITAKTK